MFKNQKNKELKIHKNLKKFKRFLVKTYIHQLKLKLNQKNQLKK